MTDLEMTKLCAEAMGYRGEGISDHWGGLPVFASEIGVYNPLTDDAQAMALVRKFNLMLDPPDSEIPEWGACFSESPHSTVINADLNRCIVECVATMQKARS